MNFPQKYMGFWLVTRSVENQWQGLYWKTGCAYTGPRYETMLTETPRDARRLARLTIAAGCVR